MARLRERGDAAPSGDGGLRCDGSVAGERRRTASGHSGRDGGVEGDDGDRTQPRRSAMHRGRQRGCASEECVDPAGDAAHDRFRMPHRIVVSTAATTCANSISAPGAAAGAVDPRSATSRWWECAPPAIGVVPVGAPSSWNRTWKAPCARKTARATRPRDCLTPTSTADSGVTRVAIARISSACGAAPPPRVWDSAASNVATEDTAAARTSRSCRAFTLSA